MTFAKDQRGFGHIEIILIIVVIGLIGAVGWLVYDRQKVKTGETATKEITSFEECVAAGNPIMESYPPQCAANGKTFIQDVGDEKLSTYNTRVTSGLKGFSIIFPDGWKDIIKDNSRDFFIINGEKQPVVTQGQAPVINSMDGFGSDGPTVFGVYIEQVSETPRGTATEFIVGKAEDELRGTKYTYIYETDDTVGAEFIGGGRLKGDRDYMYVFKLKDGKELRAWYTVYASDPTNNVATVEDVLRTITLGS